MISKNNDVQILEAKSLYKSYGHVKALVGANFSVGEGEVVGLIGDNGAGKSTMIRILSGVETPDEGEILFEGKRVIIETPTRARELGIATVFQDLALANHLDPVQNLYLGRETMMPGILGRLGFMNRDAMREHGRQLFKQLNGSVRNLDGAVLGMSGGQRQQIAVARASAWANKVIILDEPTAALGVVQTKGVMDLIRRVRDQGISVVFISHSMPHVLEVCDRVEVLRRGRRVARFQSTDTNMEQLVGAMTGAIVQEEE